MGRKSKINYIIEKTELGTKFIFLNPVNFKMGDKLVTKGALDKPEFFIERAEDGKKNKSQRRTT